jgi:hypothetical protein
MWWRWRRGRSGRPPGPAIGDIVLIVVHVRRFNPDNPRDHAGEAFINVRAGLDRSPMYVSTRDLSGPAHLWVTVRGFRWRGVLVHVEANSLPGLRQLFWIRRKDIVGPADRSR